MLSKNFFLLSAIIFVCTAVNAQSPDQLISVDEVSRIQKTLSADDMEGRRTFTQGIEKAAAFIGDEFEKAGLKQWEGLSGYRQDFFMNKQVRAEISMTADGREIAAENVIAVGPEKSLKVSEKSGFKQVTIDASPNLFREVFKFLSANEPTVIWLNPQHRQAFQRMNMIAARPVMQGSAPVIIVLHDQPRQFSIEVLREVQEQPLANIVGILPGKSKKEEYVIFSAHYDHLGIGKPDAQGDSIYNGANDDASGTTAVIMLANYFSKIKNNERTLIFVAFTAEEIGGFGSKYFSQHIPVEKVAAMFNIEMIGTDSKWGRNSAYITGFEKSDFGKILQKNLEGSKFRFEPDPYPEQQLFYRSDNATLAALGVPAHTISTSKMDSEPHYHRPSDEFETLDMVNMTEVIKGLAVSSSSIVAGKDTPSRVAIEH